MSYLEYLELVLNTVFFVHDIEIRYKYSFNDIFTHMERCTRKLWGGWKRKRKYWCLTKKCKWEKANSLVGWSEATALKGKICGKYELISQWFPLPVNFPALLVLIYSFASSTNCCWHLLCGFWWRITLQKRVNEQGVHLSVLFFAWALHLCPLTLFSSVFR